MFVKFCETVALNPWCKKFEVEKILINAGSAYSNLMPYHKKIVYNSMNTTLLNLPKFEIQHDQKKPVELYPYQKPPSISMFYYLYPTKNPIRYTYTLLDY